MLFHGFQPNAVQCLFSVLFLENFSFICLVLFTAPSTSRNSLFPGLAELLMVFDVARVNSPVHQNLVVLTEAYVG